MRTSTGNHTFVDRTGIVFGQSVTAAALVGAFLADAWTVAAAMSVINLFGAAVPGVAPLGALYRRSGPRLGLRPRIVPDDPAAHRFAQAFSGTVTGIGAVAVAGGALALLGWALILMVAALAVANVTAGFCLGCFTYHQLARFGIAGRS